jgi:hypothetical protein
MVHFDMLLKKDKFTKLFDIVLYNNKLHSGKWTHFALQCMWNISFVSLSDDGQEDCPKHDVV